MKNKIRAVSTIKVLKILAEKLDSESFAKKMKFYTVFLARVGKKNIFKLLSFLWTGIKNFPLLFVSKSLESEGSATSVLQMLRAHGGALLRKLKITGSINSDESKLLNIITAADAGEDDKSIISRLTKYLNVSSFKALLGKILNMIPSGNLKKYFGFTAIKNGISKVLDKISSVALGLLLVRKDKQLYEEWLKSFTEANIIKIVKE